MIIKKSNIVSSTFADSQKNEPPIWSTVSIFILCLVGIVVSSELIRIHVKVYTDSSFHSFCALSEGINCETVAESRYAVFWFLPVAVWGVLGYLVIGSLALWNLIYRKYGREGKFFTWGFSIIFILGLISILIDVVLAYISHKIIHSICILCTTAYFINFLILFFSILQIKYSGKSFTTHFITDIEFILTYKKGFSIWCLSWVVILALLYFFYPKYWIAKRTDQGQKYFSSGVTKEGYPWIGAQDGVIIEEFSDYQCPHCRRAHHAIRQLLFLFPDKLKLVHHHYPLDHNCNRLLKGRPFHTMACFLSKIAICAQKYGKFWEANDLLFEYQLRASKPTVNSIAAELGLNAERLEECLKEKSTQELLHRDIELGLKLNIVGTPSFKIGDRIYPGMIPQDVLEEIVLKK